MVAAQVDFALSTMRTRIPYWGEAEVLFDASRLRAHLPLFVDPHVGTADVPPSRWYVTYPPLWAFVLSLVPAAKATIAGRALASLAWFGTLFALGRKRPIALVCAAYVAGSWVLANFATVARPDSIACALAAWGLARALEKKRVDVLSAVLLAIVPWVKPTLIGLPLGVLVADAWSRRAWESLAISASTAIGLGAVLQLASGGVLLAHVVASNAQAFTLEAWLDHVPSRLPFFAPPIALAAYAAWTARSAVAKGAVVGSSVWTSLALAKIGSASNYWMEPCIAAVAIVAYVPFALPRFTSCIALASVGYAGVAAVGGATQHRRDYVAEAAFLDVVQAQCPGTISADEAGIELVHDGRILLPTYQFSQLVTAGRWPAKLWADDIAATECFVSHTGQLPPSVRALVPLTSIVRFQSFEVYRVSARAP